MIREWETKKQLAFALVLATAVGAGLFTYCAITNHSLQYDYLLWNLLLAWVPLIISTRLIYVLSKKLWSSWEAMGLSILWLIFLPNSFYMISDFIHLETAPTNSAIYYAITFTSIIYTAVVIGFLSLYMVHIELRRRLDSNTVRLILALILASCSAAIYIGRDLRWSSWDVITNPGGVLFDISDRLVHISDYRTMLTTGIMFFVLLASMYFLAWSGIRTIKRQRI
jgi:uncharacterized membrane protein